MRRSQHWMATSVVALLLLMASNSVLAQKVYLQREFIRPDQILTIRMYYHPNLTPPQPVMEIFLKDPNKPGFILKGESGKVLESFHDMQELAILLRKQSFVLLFDWGGFVTETNHPFFVKTNYSKKMYNIMGFYGIGYPAAGGPPSPNTPPKNVPMQGHVIPGPPPSDQIGFCCLHGKVVEAPARACQMEGGAFFRDPDSAHRNCKVRDGR
jgi:hypothetical protein